jgi:gamma-glutamyl-gamma-aminobutyrate hydrolase PuuD
MKKLAISQRVDEHQAYAERRDCLDQRWYEFAESLNCAPIPLPNIDADKVDAYLSMISPDAIILSGGNTILEQKEDAKDVAPERDAFESALLEWGLASNTPILGVCRGMQFINHYFGGSTCVVSEHVAQRHRVSFRGDMSDAAAMDVNSFHEFGLKPEQLGNQLSALAMAEDGTVEALSHASQKIAAVMWHPEREKPFSEFDLSLARRLLKL